MARTYKIIQDWETGERRIVEVEDPKTKVDEDRADAELRLKVHQLLDRRIR